MTKILIFFHACLLLAANSAAAHSEELSPAEVVAEVCRVSPPDTYCRTIHLAGPKIYLPPAVVGDAVVRDRLGKEVDRSKLNRGIKEGSDPTDPYTINIATCELFISSGLRLAQLQTLASTMLMYGDRIQRIYCRPSKEGEENI